MLSRIFIQNLATVEKQVIEFNNGFTALTGETGAGKSIIIKAINLILGEKCPKDLIRAQEDFLSVEAVFSIQDNPPVLDLLEELDIEHEGELTIRRKVHLNGKSSIFINDYTSRLSQLTQLGMHLIDLHGQHSQQALLHTATHIDYLDQYSGLKDAVTEFRGLYQSLLHKQKEKTAFDESLADRTRQLDFIRFQIDEIERAGFTAEEEQQLSEEYRLLTYGEQIIEAVSPVASWNSGQNSTLSEISVALQALTDILNIAPDLKPIVDEIQSGLITLEEVAAEARQYLGRIDMNPERLGSINERLAQLDSLKRKYGKTLTAVLQFKADQENEREQLENLEVNSAKLDEEIRDLSLQVHEKARSLSEIRRKNVAVFEKLVLANLKELGLERSLFKVQQSHLPKEEGVGQTFSQKGMDRVEFLITTNPGNPLKPLAKVASGGEISRIMLAIKTTLNEDITRGTMIFDEVDAGISGRVAETVGYKLVKLGSHRQVICITHSPQIASKALTHLKVEKVFADNVSRTLITQLKESERIEEIARFLGGTEITEKTISVARDMLIQ
ncbi:MAG: DNA repair protein RecN [SAR324 cluster bacterium]|nr:DNA repair protein RecN [SAR324 cluster bacterium]